MTVPKRHIRVVCGIIEQNGLILATQRSGKMSLPLKWEFPGGKLEPGETLQQCLLRELQEELGVTVRVGQGLTPVDHDYPDFSVTLYPFRCDQLSGAPVLHEHLNSCWLPPGRLAELDWAAADQPIIAALVQQA